MADKIKRKISETSYYKLIRVTYLDSGYSARCRYIHYNIIDKITGRCVGTYSDLKSAKKELQSIEKDKQLLNELKQRMETKEGWEHYDNKQIY